MENATKALLIAAAILIAIVLISLGVYVLNRGESTVKDAARNMDQTQIMAINSKFTSYEGTIRGSQVNALAQTVITHNQSEKPENGGSGAYVLITHANSTGTAATGTTSWTAVNTGSMYKVSFTYTNGLITGITITDA